MDALNTWGIDPDVPANWPSPLTEYTAAALTFGLSPSSTNLLRVVTKARELGSNESLPPEIEVVVEAALDPTRGYRLPGFASWFLRVSDVELDSVEELIRRSRSERGAQQSERGNHS